MTRTISLAFATFLAACSSPAGGGQAGTSAGMAASPVPVQSSPASDAGPAAVDPEAIVRAYKTDAFVRINQSGVEGTGPHTSGKPLFVYVDKEHAALSPRDVAGPMPAGTTIVKVAAEGEDKVVAIMKKLPAGTDPGAGDWYFWERLGGSIPFDGNKAKGGGLCYSCHKAAPTKADGLLGTDLFGN